MEGMPRENRLHGELIDLLMVFPRKVGAVNRSIISRYMKDTRVRPYHLMLMRGIASFDGASQKDLGEVIPFDKSYISTGVRELMDMGLVVNSGGGKTHCLRLTETGRDMSAMGDMLFDIVGNTIMSVLTEDEIDNLTRILRKIDEHSNEVIESFCDSSDVN